MIVTCSEMRAAEERCFESGISASDLMEEASAGIASAIRQFFPAPGRLVLYLGGGNNAGDAVVAGRILREAGWRVFVRRITEELSELTLKKLNGVAMADEDGFLEIPSGWDVTGVSGEGPLVLVDGLVGIGARGALRSPLAEAAEEINALRQREHAQVVAVDIPSGIDGDTGQVFEGAVQADLTCTVGAVKSGLIADTATGHVGRLVLVPLDELELEADKDPLSYGDGQAARMLTAGTLRASLPRCSFDTHKGQAGRVGIVAGSRGMFGAARLAAEGALRAGAGLVTLHVLEEDYDHVVGTVTPEVMVRPVKDYHEVLTHPADALAIGPGLGRSRDADVIGLCVAAGVPAVVDADALNALAAAAGRDKDLWDSLGEAGLRLLTPHPGEMLRMLGDEGGETLERAATVRMFLSGREGVALLLKGARTVVGAASEPIAFNTTGTPGMATGGMGDVLSGVAAALLARGCTPYDAGCLGAWLCGRAAERAIVDDDESIESLTAGSVPKNLGGAFHDLRDGVW